MKIVSLCLAATLAMFTFTGSGSSAPVAAPQDDSFAAGGSCGGNTCGKNQHCCNASCGWCVPIGMECPQIACAIGAPDPDELAF
jgi:hypothetical protein